MNVNKEKEVKKYTQKEIKEILDNVIFLQHVANKVLEEKPDANLKIKTGE